MSLNSSFFYFIMAAEAFILPFCDYLLAWTAGINKRKGADRFPALNQAGRAYVTQSK